jgi:hypothetical protein
MILLIFSQVKDHRTYQRNNSHKERQLFTQLQFPKYQIKEQNFDD